MSRARNNHVRVERIDNSDKRLRGISPFDNGSYHMGTIRTNGTNRQLKEAFLAYSVLEIVPLMRCISPFDNGSYHMGTICANRQLGQASLSIQRVGHILSPVNEMHLHSRTGRITCARFVRIDNSKEGFLAFSVLGIYKSP